MGINEGDLKVHLKVVRIDLWKKLMVNHYSGITIGNHPTQWVMINLLSNFEKYWTIAMYPTS